MTRINLVAPIELIDQHLRAEWRELPRIFGLVRKAIAAGKGPADFPVPAAYALGKGHMLGFYCRLEFLAKRHEALTMEMGERGFQLNYTSLREAYADITDPAWWGDWTPTPEDIAISAGRLDQRKAEISGFKLLKTYLKTNAFIPKGQTVNADTEVTQVRYEDGSTQWVILPEAEAKKLVGFKEVIVTSKLKLLNEASVIVRPPEGSPELENAGQWHVQRDPLGKIVEVAGEANEYDY